MIKTIEELKSLILWAKEQKLACLKIGDVEFHVSAYGLVETQTAPSQPPQTPDLPEIDPESDAPYTNEELFHSAT